MVKRKNNPWQVIMVYMIMVLCGVFSLNLPGESGDKWVSVSSAGSHSKEGTPGLQVVRSDQGNLSMVMRTDGFFSSERTENGRVYTTLQMGKYNSDMKPGSPYLPAVRQYIYIPAGKTARLKVNPGPPVTFHNYTIYPVQQPDSDLKIGVEPSFYYDDAVYNADRLFPSELVSLGETESVRGHQIALLHICPFHYNPARKVLYVYPDMEVQVTFTGENRAVSSRLRSSPFDSFIRGIVLNPGAAGKKEPAAISTDSEGADFLIITAPEFLAAANALHDHKESLGIDTVVKTTIDTGITSPAIKNYIQDAYDNWSPATSYVLLLGDVVYIPVHYRTLDPANTYYTIGTDLYYACVDGQDYQPDIFLGRISVDTLSEAQTVVQKIINYENNPPSLATFYANAAVVAYFKDYYEDGFEDNRNVKTAEEIRDFLATRGYNVERIYLGDTYWSNPSYYNNDYYGNGGPLPPDLLFSNGFSWDGDTGKIISAFNSGVSLMIFRGDAEELGWRNPEFSENDIATLNNGGLLPVVFSNSSESGYFDAETDDHYNSFDSFCEILLRKANGGAAAVIGPSRSDYDGYKDFMDEGFIDSVWPDFLPAVPNPDGASPRLGPMLNHGKIAMDILWGDPRGFRKAEYEMVHLFGDPTMALWTQQPGSIGTQTVKIQSDPGFGIPISVSQKDINGNGDGATFFTRTYPTGTAVTVTAPATFYGGSFVKWMVAGVIVENTSIELTMDRYHQAIVYYSDEKTLNVKSFPVNGVPITVTPDDNTGSGNGNTNFSRYYNTGVEVTLTAPVGFSGRYFVRWRVDGVDGVPDANRTIHVAMDAGHTVSAEFTILSVDKKVLIIDKDLTTTNGQKIKTAIEANGFNTEYSPFFTPPEISFQLYPAVFVTGGSLTLAECARFTKYLDSGGNLYIENLSYPNSYFQEFLKSRFGIEDAWGSSDITRLTGMPGTFTDGFDFTFPVDTFYTARLDWVDEVTGTLVIWDSLLYSYTYHAGVARDANTFKTIGVGFNFGDIPQNNRTAVMKKYLDFFIPQSPVVRTIQITSPNGGENLALGAVHAVGWNAANISSPLKISLWKDGLPVGVIADQIDPGRSQYKWKVGNYAGGTASPGAGYAIKVEEMGTGICDLSNAAFTISAAPSLHVTSPNGGENLTSGAAHTITWNSSNVSGTLKITLWKNGTQVGVVADGLNPSPGTYPWTVGNYSGGTASPGAGFKIKIEENGSAVSDMSDGPFTILPIPTITVACPNDDESLLTGTILPITWNAANVTGALKITLWKDGALVGIIAHGIDSFKRQYAWTVGVYEGGVAPPGGGYKVKIEETKTGVSDDSDQAFSIAGPPSLIVTSPNGGDNLSLGATHNITWESSNISGTLKISLLKNGSLVGVIADNINPGDTSYAWTVGNYSGGKAYADTGYKVKIEENGSSAVDSSDKPFTISDESITVVSPNGDENLTIGKTHLITWTASGVKGSLKISLWKNDAQVGVIAGKVDQSRNSFLWTVGNYAGGTAPAGTGYEVKIEDEATSCSDISNDFFTLSDPPSITVTSPNGDENLINGSTHLITWNSVNISGTLKITLWGHDSFYVVIADNINPAVTSYPWTVNSFFGDVFKIKIEENGTTVSDMSDGGFTISYAPLISSIAIFDSPVYNNFFLGQTYEIYWSSNNIKRPVKITLWKDGVSVGTIADYLDPKVHSYYWKMGDYVGGTAGPGTGYKVKIEEHDTGVSGIIDDPFTILPIPAIIVTSPVGGEVLTKGTTFNITWKASNVPWTLNIRLLKNNEFRGTIASYIGPGVTSYQWTVGNSSYGFAPEGSGYQVEVGVDDTNFSGKSNPYFAIYYPPSITITSPNGGEGWGLDDVKDISWGVMKVSGTLKFTLWQDSVLVGVIADGVNPTADNYSWSVGSYIGGKVSPGAGYRIKIEENGSTVSDMSNAPFEITPAHTIRVISPNGGENFQVGTTQTITWTSANVTNHLYIYLWRDDSEWTSIDYVDPEETSYQWFVDEEVGEGYKIKIEEEGTAYSDLSDNWFTITGAYSLRVTSPNGGELWAKNTVKQITWTSTGLYGPVRIYLTKEGESDEYITQVADVAAGYYNWTVGSQYYGAGSGYKIKIETNVSPYIYDKSNNPFTITDN